MLTTVDPRCCDLVHGDEGRHRSIIVPRSSETPPRDSTRSVCNSKEFGTTMPRRFRAVRRLHRSVVRIQARSAGSRTPPTKALTSAGGASPAIVEPVHLGHAGRCRGPDRNVRCIVKALVVGIERLFLERTSGQINPVPRVEMIR